MDHRWIEIRLTVDDLFALDADQVRMGLRAITVVMAVVAQIDLQHLAQLLQ